MAVRKLVELSLFDKLFNKFIDAKANNKQHSFISNIQKKDPELAKMYSNWNDKMDKSLNTAKAILKNKGLSTKKIDKVLNKRY